MLAAIAFPSWIKPEIIPGLPFRWYGLMYVIAFALTWLLFSYESKRRKAPWTNDDATNFFFWAIVGLLIGARIFGTLVYDPTGYYWAKPWLIFWPFGSDGRFAGFQGMSYHGGLVGLIAATVIFCLVKKSPWLQWADVIAVSAPLGYTFGRLGNFINGELWGKITASPLGMIFPNVPASDRFSAREAWVQDFASRTGIKLSSMNDLVNLPRYPSQLFEAAFEGLLLWLVLWFFIRKRKSFPGFAMGVYVIGYGVIRFVIEYFREPDAGIGYVLSLGNKSAPTYLFTTPWDFSMGQLFCLGMVIAGGLFLFFAGRHARLTASAVEGESEARQSAAAEARRLRKKIK
ncbi:MAG: prolipoprotein diacylglyceryl transferase [Treponema sp.]|nr:prolipoprotein diacylglyceryl transferase [Treponema sp.]